MDLAALVEILRAYLFWDPMIQLEAALVTIVLALSFFIRKKPRLFQIIDTLLAKGGAHKAHAMIGIFLATLLLHAGISQLRPMRHPKVHDEFSYLLAADTFLHGRLSNPSHPMWEHFEAVHVLSKPTYSSMYPPLQGAILAGGKLIIGYYLAGPWICSAILCALIYWMLTGWMSARWAFLGALFCVLRIGALSYWANSYWGGAHTAIGGALMMGTVPGIVRQPRKLHAIPVSLGLLMLASSRPFEGFFFALSFAVLMAFKFRQTKRACFKKSLFIVVPLCVGIVIPGFFALGYYNKQVTGNWFQMPQRENMASYGLAVLPWQSIQAERIPRAAHLQTFYGVQRERFQNFYTAAGFIKSQFKAFFHFWCFYVCPLITIPLLFFLYHWRRQRYFCLLIASLIFSVSLIINPNFFPHYFSPAFGLYWLIVILGLRIMRGFRTRYSRSKPFLLFVRLAPICMIIVAASSVLGIGLRLLKAPGSDYVPPWHYTGQGNIQRAEIISRLQALEGKHLVLVSYAQDRNVLTDWVYNEADIDSSKIVFAHDFGDMNNRRLFQYYADRQVWLINIDLSPLELRKLSGRSDVMQNQ